MDSARLIALQSISSVSLTRSAIVLKLVWPTLEALGYTADDCEVVDIDATPSVPACTEFRIKDSFTLRLVPEGSPVPVVAPGLWTHGRVYTLVGDNKLTTAWGLGEPENFKFLAKGAVDLTALLASSEGARISALFTKFLQAEIASPSGAFINFMSQQALGASASAEKQEELRPSVKAALEATCAPAVIPLVTPVPFEEPEAKILRSLRALLADSIEPARLGLRTTSGYVAVLVDCNGRKPLCRLYLKGEQHYVGFFNAERKEEKVVVPASGIWDEFKAGLVATVDLFKAEAA